MASYGGGVNFFGAATSGSSVPANSMAICVYTPTSRTRSSTGTTAPGWSTTSGTVIRVFGPSATILSTFTSVPGGFYGAAQSPPTTQETVTFTFQSGVILKNS